MPTNYNIDLDPRLFGRDAAGKASSAPADATRTQQQSDKPKSKDAPEYRITEVTIVVPSDGLKKDKPFDIKGKVQPLTGTITKKKVRIELVTRYKGAEDKFSTVESDIGGDNAFTGSCKQLFYHDEYQRDKEKASDAKFTLEAKASGAGAEKEVVSKIVDLPMATATVILKKGNYDETWSSKNEATHPKNGKEFVPDNKVKKLQDNQVTFRFLKQAQVNGMFDDATDAAVKKFQELATKPERKKASDVKLVKAEKITFDGDADGIVGEKTENEIAVWIKNNWVKPDPEYRKGDYDDNGVKNNCGESGKEKHHPGTGITEFQKDLAAVGAFREKTYGCFGEKTEESVKLFQEKVSQGELVDKKGKKIEVPENERLAGHRNVVGDGVTVEYARKAKEREWKVAGPGYPVHFTFDDGPHAVLTPKVLDILKEESVISTFFVKGEHFAGGKTNPKTKPFYTILDRAKKEGHTIGSHTYSHMEHPKFSEDKVRENILKPVPVLNEYLSPVLRLPYGAGAIRSPKPAIQAKNDMVMDMVKKAGFKHVLWDIDTNDWDKEKGLICCRLC
jgi:peptidoglycan/xylan/chitin deacetylase (PgdA/CDA1 family)